MREEKGLLVALSRGTKRSFATYHSRKLYDMSVDKHFPCYHARTRSTCMVVASTRAAADSTDQINQSIDRLGGLDCSPVPLEHGLQSFVRPFRKLPADVVLGFGRQHEAPRLRPPTAPRQRRSVRWSVRLCVRRKR